jgi:hypothetical protein
MSGSTETEPAPYTLRVFASQQERVQWAAIKQSPKTTIENPAIIILRL